MAFSSKKIAAEIFFFLLRACVRVVRNCKLVTQHSWKKEFQSNKMESHPIILVICLETLANRYCSLSYVWKIAMVATEIESVSQESLNNHFLQYEHHPKHRKREICELDLERDPK